MQRRTYLAGLTGSISLTAGCSTGLLTEESEAAFEFANLDVPDLVESDSEFDIQVGVKNVGNADGGDSFDLAIDGEKVKREYADISEGGEALITFTLYAHQFDPGEKDVTVLMEDGDDEIAGRFEIEAPVPSTYSIQDVSIPDRIAPDDIFGIEVTVLNEGEKRDVRSLDIEIGGSVVKSSLASSAPGEEDTRSISIWDANPNPGTQQVTVRTESDEVVEEIFVEFPNPWGVEPVRVTHYEDGSLRNDPEQVISRALAFWEDSAPEYTEHEIDFEYIGEGEEAEIEVIFRDEIDSCSNHEVPDDLVIAGCAPYHFDEASAPTEVQIRAGFPEENTVSTLMHELGHTLGLNHNSEPAPLMSDDPDVKDSEYTGGY